MLLDFFNLIFPRLCFACNEALLKGENFLCISCQINLPKTDFHKDKENRVAQSFWGRINIEIATSYYYFNKGGKVQNLIHHLKYKGDKEVGEYIGKQYGYDLREVEHFQSIDFIVPVPLHPKKEKKRGYNQSEWFAKGLSTTMGIPINTEILYRKENSETQTKKGRYDRWENVNEVFGVKQEAKIAGKNILLVDDVITTGATLEACAEVLLKQKTGVIKIATIACA